MITFSGIDMPCRVDRKRAVKLWLKNEVKLRGKNVGDIGLALCSDEHLLEINNQYLAHDYYTDIITFDYSEGDLISGDLMISYDRVSENAKTNGVSVQNELRRVIVHGVLHLLGSKDKTDKESKEMRVLEDAALGRFHVEHDNK
jgi:probable rRNA maturation factor|tara:strand:+ start:80 stop:511 length:432 start_codon:yes stop_codon:yes gene_type:complete